MSDLVFGLGANLGDRADALRGAVRSLGLLGEIVAVSGIFESAAVGGPPGQPPYLNAAVRLETQSGPAEWLSAMVAIEQAAGRVRTIRHGPRVLDVDLLWARGERVSRSDLVVPHLRLEERPFAWLPLLEVAPDAAPPEGAVPYGNMLLAYDWIDVTPRASARLWCPEFPRELQQLRPI